MRNFAAIQRVRKLLHLAESPNPHEAALAASQAKALMAKLGLKPEDVADDVQEVVEERREPYRQELARVVAMAYGCVPIMSGRGAVAYRGRPTVVKRARDTYAALSKYADAHCEMSPMGDPPDAARLAWRICYWLGFCGETAKRLRLPQAGAAAGGRGRKNL